MNQRWTIHAGIFKPEQIIICNKLNLFFGQEPINRQVYAFRDFESENDMNAFVRRIIDQVYDKDQEQNKTLFDEFSQTKKLNLATLNFIAEIKF